MEESTPHYTSLANVHEEEDGGTTRTKTHRRHQSLFSHSSAPVDLSSYPSMRSATSTSLRKSASGSLNWKLGEFWSKLRAPLKQNASSRPGTLSNTLEKQTENDETPDDVSRSGNTLEKQAESDEIPDAISGSGTLSNTLEKQTGTGIGFQESVAEAVEAVSPTSKSKSLHFISLNLFSSSKFSSSREFSIPSAEEEPALATRWRDIHGASNWRGLTEPLDLDLRRELLRYGDFAQMANDNFENNARSRYAGSARCAKQALFRRRACGYEATRYLYAASERPTSLASKPWDAHSTWVGYVAVAMDAREIARLGRRDIVVVWRGAGRAVEWMGDAQKEMVAVKVAGGVEVKVERAFWSLFSEKRAASRFNRKSASEQVITELQRLLSLYKAEPLSITLTGHNLGGALATLTAYTLAHLNLNPTPITAFTFGSPPVGDAAFRTRFTHLQIPLLQITNPHDMVPKCTFWSKHAGMELQVNHKMSPYLRGSKEVVDWNDLEVYLHLVDGCQGKQFELVTGRDVALVNKYTDVLQVRLCVSARWWGPENKGLVLVEGRWVERERVGEEDPLNHEKFV